MANIEVLVHLNVEVDDENKTDEEIKLEAVNRAIAAARAGFREFDDLVILVDPQ